MPKISWNSYKAINAFDEYVTSENKLRSESKKISNFIGSIQLKDC